MPRYRCRANRSAPAQAAAWTCCCARRQRRAARASWPAQARPTRQAHSRRARTPCGTPRRPRDDLPPLYRERCHAACCCDVAHMRACRRVPLPSKVSMCMAGFLSWAPGDGKGHLSVCGAGAPLCRKRVWLPRATLAAELAPGGQVCTRCQHPRGPTRMLSFRCC